MGPLTMMRRAGLSCSGKDVNVFILSDVCAVPSSLIRSKMAGYAAKESSPRWFLHISANVEAVLGGPSTYSASGGRGGGGGGNLAVPSLVCPWVGLSGGGAREGGVSGYEKWPVPTCSHSIASSPPAAVTGMFGAVGCVGCAGVGGAGGSLVVLAAARPWRISMSSLISSA